MVSVFSTSSLSGRHKMPKFSRDSQDDAATPCPSALLHAIDRKRDAELANAVSATEIMIFDCYKTGSLSQRTGKIFLNMVRHLLFDPKDLCSETFVHLLRLLKPLFEETVMHTYNLW